MRISDWSSDVCSSDLVGNVAHVPCRYDQPPRIGGFADLPDNLRDLVDVPAGAGWPTAPLHAIYRAQVAAFVGPFVPDAYASFLQPAHVRIAAQKPQQFNKNAFGVQFFGGDQRKALAQVETHLVTEDRPRAGAGAVGFGLTLFVDMPHEIFVLVHKR